MTPPTRRPDTVRLLIIELAVLLLTQKCAIPFGGTQIQSALAVHLLFLALLFATGRLRVAEPQALLYLATAGLALIVHTLLTPPGFSVPSLLSFLAIYGITCFVVELQPADYRRLMRAVQTMALLAAGAVWIDWATQLAGLHMPDIEPLIPRAIRLADYIYIQPVTWGSHWMKPNGIFFPETSFVSTFLGLAVTIEIALFRRWMHLMALTASLFATLGGSGMLLLALVAPFVLPRLSLRAAASLACGAAMLALVGAQFGFFDSLMQRSAEFSEQNSSGYHRFIEPVMLLGQSFSRGTLQTLVGSGAGTAAKGLNIIWSPIAKAVAEYGLVFGALFMLLTIRFMFGAGRPFLIGWACFVSYHLLGGGFVVPWFAVMVWMLVGGYTIGPAIQPRRASYTAITESYSPSAPSRLPGSIRL